MSQNYDPNQLPNMTKDQAMHILSQPYDAYPYQVRRQAVAIASSIQDIISQSSRLNYERNQYQTIINRDYRINL